jgi:hypothetical protein
MPAPVKCTAHPGLADLPGTWQRSLLVDADGRRDTTTWVTWVQGPSHYADLRQPHGRPHRRGTSSLADLTHEQLLALTEQEAFAGSLNEADGVFHWSRHLDYSPSALPDAGMLRWDGPVLVEDGLHVPYVEHWHRTPEPRSESAAYVMLDPAEGCSGVLVRAGSWFAYARDRPEPDAPGISLAESVRGAGDLARARDLVDFEVSIGRVAADGRWRIERSTLPHRQGTELAPSFAAVDRLTVADAAPDGVEYRRSWQITAAEGVTAAALTR